MFTRDVQIQIARLDTGGCGFRPVTVQRPWHVTIPPARELVARCRGHTRDPTVHSTNSGDPTPLGVISVVSIRFRPMPTIRADNLN